MPNQTTTLTKCLGECFSVCAQDECVINQTAITVGKHWTNNRWLNNETMISGKREEELFAGQVDLQFCSSESLPWLFDCVIAT